MMCVACFAILPFVAIARCHSLERLAAESDVKDGLYSRGIYILVTVSLIIHILCYYFMNTIMEFGNTVC